MSRFKTLKRNTKITLTGAVAVALIAAGVGVWLLNTEDPRPASHTPKDPGNQASQGSEATYQHIAALCDEIDWSMLEDEFGPIGHTQETDRPSSAGTGGASGCTSPFGMDREGSGANVSLRAFVNNSEKDSIDGAQNQSGTLKLTKNGNRFFPDWDYSKVGGFIENQPYASSSGEWLEHLKIVVQRGNLVVEMTLNLQADPEPDTDTPLDENALAMQIAVSLTDQVEELAHK